MKSKATLIGIVILIGLAIGLGWYLKTAPGGNPLTGKPNKNAPADWPENVPFPENAHLRGKTEYGENGTRYEIDVDQTETQTKQFFENAFKQNGWQMQPQAVGLIGSQIWRRGVFLAELMVKGEGGKSFATIMLRNMPQMPDQVKAPGEPPKNVPWKPGSVGADGIGDLPDNVPVFKGLTFTEREVRSSGNVWYIYSSTGTYKELIEFYPKAMGEKGWQMIADTTSTSPTVQAFQQIYEKDKVRIGVRVMPKTPTEVTYILFREDANIPNIEIAKPGDVKIEKTPPGKPQENKNNEVKQPENNNPEGVKGKN